MMMKAVTLARHTLGFGMTRAEVAQVLIEAGYTVEDAFLALAAARVLDRDYVCVPDRGNRSESCVQVLE